ncbi:uncharacterized protein MYCFIDRAFT_214617 [Pseudocercospora fijiensis CIRAD86]|uniref:DUF7918 domain-containing protein n=1 Tax=Pseudocercospora fijiensis (strain CIRAD86) TaxID=383855 RepID=M3AHN9_PSEFD|nr:uncharacterized protein MYCFIDRAFT_214617 [Pseudocercospora fijiensis CIRAD86]EME84101.1 hypothetical protein MYCFIDRAFT_214617 [Pseudocercospora fijiensis CIRAD86]
MKTLTTEGLTVELTVAGQVLHEYEDEDSTLGNSASSYVEVDEGSNFMVRVTARENIAPSPLDRLGVSIRLDGKYVVGRLCSLERMHHGKATWSFEGRERNTSRGTVIERFQFAPLQTSGEKVEAFKSLGEVQVDCIFERPRGKPRVVQDDSRFESAFASNINEKCLKGRSISNHATLGPQELRGGSQVTMQSTDRPYGPEPFATYKFKYRSRRDLQIEGIIPRSPSPTPLEDRDPDDLTPEEARELVRRMREREKLQAAIKKEIKREKRNRSDTLNVDDESDHEGVLVTGEGPARKRARASTDSGIECIDLTGE